MTGTERPVRVAFVIDALAPGAGTENQLILLLKHFDRGRVEPRVWCLRQGPTAQELGLAAPLEVLDVAKLASVAGARALWRLSRALRATRADVVLTFFRDANWFGTLAGRLAGVPVVSSRRNLGKGYWHSRRSLMGLRVLNRMTRAFVANSEAVRQYTHAAEGVPLGRIQVLYNAVDTTLFRPGTAEERVAVRRALGVPVDRPLVGCVANLRPVKGLETLLAAFARVAATESGADLVLVGDGPQKAALAAQAHELQISDRIHWLGSRTDTAQLLRAFDVGVLSSLAESSSNALLEYLAAGLPAVATDVGGSTELLDGGQLGLLVPPSDPSALAEALLRMLGDAALRSRCASAARQRAEERHGVPAVVDAWQRFFDRFSEA